MYCHQLLSALINFEHFKTLNRVKGNFSSHVCWANSCQLSTLILVWPRAWELNKIPTRIKSLNSRTTLMLDWPGLDQFLKEAKEIKQNPRHYVWSLKSNISVNVLFRNLLLDSFFSSIYLKNQAVGKSYATLSKRKSSLDRRKVACNWLQDWHQNSELTWSSSWWAEWRKTKSWQRVRWLVHSLLRPRQEPEAEQQDTECLSIILRWSNIDSFNLIGRL